jgi:two-component system, OmpR family, KDP operon response regulator KdpE
MHMSAPRILLIDDDPVTRKALEFKLGSQGYQVVAAATGSEALKAATEQKPNLMILDLKLDSNPLETMRDGFTLLGWMRRMLPDCNFPVIVHTIGATEEVEERAQAEGVYAVLQKSADPQRVLDTVQQALQAGGQASAAAA